MPHKKTIRLPLIALISVLLTVCLLIPIWADDWTEPDTPPEMEGLYIVVNAAHESELRKMTPQKLTEYRQTTQSIDIVVGQTLPLDLMMDGQSVAIAASWESEDLSIATISRSGMVTGNTPGTVVIKGSYEFDTAEITVRVVSEFSKTDPNAVATCGKGYHLDLNMTGTLDPLYYTIKWTDKGSAEGTSAAVDGNNVYRPMSYGSVTVCAHIYANRTTSGTPDYETMFDIEVVPAALSVSIDNPSIPRSRTVRVEKKETIVLRTNVAPASAMQQIRWESSDPTVAEVVDNTIVCHKQGKTILTATAQYWDGLQFNDVTLTKASFTLDVWDETLKEFNVKIIQPQVGSLTVYKDGVAYTDTMTANPGTILTIKATGITETSENGFKQHSLDFVQAMFGTQCANVTPTGEKDTYTFEMPVSDVEVSATPVTLFTVAYNSDYEANFARNGNLIGEITITESVAGTFNGTYNIRIGSGDRSIIINDAIASGGDAVVNDDGTVTIYYDTDPETEAAVSTILLYADAQFIESGKYNMYVTGSLEFTVADVVNAHIKGEILDTDVVVEPSRIRDLPQGGSITIDAGTGVIVYGDLFKEAVAKNVSYIMNFSVGSLTIPYATLQGIENVDDNAFIRFSMINTSGATNNTLGSYQITAVLYSGTGVATNIIGQLKNCTLKIANNGANSKATLINGSFSKEMSAGNKEYSLKIDNLSNVDVFTVSLAASAVNWGDILLYGGVGILIAALIVFLFILRKKRKQLEEANKPVEMPTVGDEALLEEGDGDDNGAAYTDDTFRTVQSVLHSAGLAEDISQMRKTAEEELGREQARGRTEAVLAKHDVETASQAATVDAEMNGVSTAEGQVGTYLANGKALIASADDIIDRCDITADSFADDELLLFIDRLRNDIAALSSGVKTFKGDYEIVSAWILSEKEAAEQRRIQAVNRMLDEYASAIDAAKEHWTHDDAILTKVKAGRLSMDAEESIADRLTGLDEQITSAEGIVNNLATAKSSAEIFITLARARKSDDGIAEKMQTIRDATYASDEAADRLDEAYQSCLTEYNRIITERKSAESMRKASLVASIGAYFAISDKALVERDNKLAFVKEECISVYPEAVTAFSERYSAGIVFLSGMRADVEQARNISMETADMYGIDDLQTLSDKLKNDFADDSINTLHTEAMNFVSEKKQNDLSAQLSEAERQNAELRSEMDGYEQELNAALAGLGSRAENDTPVTDETVAALEALLAREGREYPANVKVFTECIPADREANMYIKAMTTLAERVHANAAKIAATDYKNAGENQVGNVITILTDDLDLLSETRNDIEGSVQSAKPHKYGRKKLKYWKNALNSNDPGRAAEASNRIAAHKASGKK